MLTNADINEYQIRVCIAERRKFCNVDSKPKALIQYARNGATRIAQQTLVEASIQKYYADSRRYNPAFVGD